MYLFSLLQIDLPSYPQNKKPFSRLFTDIIISFFYSYDNCLFLIFSELSRIYDHLYTNAVSYTHLVGGTGLGLSIVKHAAKIHDAKIKLSSVPDQGTEITVIFPKSLS